MSCGKRWRPCDPDETEVYLGLIMNKTQPAVPPDDGRVTIRVFGGLRELTGRAPLEVPAREASTVTALLSLLDRDQPKLAEALHSGIRDGYLNILVNGRNVRFLSEGVTPLSSGDTVAFLPPIGGG
jgi:MoaD family protein